MSKYVYLIIGGGKITDASVSGIHTIDMGGSIGTISSEANMSYNRIN